MWNDDVRAVAPTTGAHVLIADDDVRIRGLFATLLRAATGVGAVLEADDGAEAVEIAVAAHVDIAVLDLNMPRLDGLDAALRLCELDPAPRVALHSSDPDLLRHRAAGLELPLFDKLEFDRVLEWVERGVAEAPGTAPTARGRVSAMVRTVDLCCALCGYGVACRAAPDRCPMCGGVAAWIDPPGWTARRAALQQRLAG